MEEPGINEAHAKALLRALYKLDGPVNRLFEILASMPPGTERDHFKDALSDLVGIVLSDLMVPIYRIQPHLGRASEPGPWLNESQA